MQGRTNILDLTAAELEQSARAKLPSGARVARQIYGQVMRQARFAPEELGISSRSAQSWQQQYCLELPELVGTRAETGAGAMVVETTKALLLRPDGLEYECVRIPMGEEGESLCLSSQVGCAAGCRFCETGGMGFLAQLDASEIVAQLLLARCLGWRPRSLVFMGMGEPLDNFRALAQALRILMDPAGLCFSQKKITICSVGRVWGIRRLAELQAALIEYRQRRNLQIGISYTLLPGINDSREDARSVARFCAPLGRTMVYLLPYNPGTRPLTRAPTERQVDLFIGWLRAEGLPVRRRITKGQEVMAACGQLGRGQLRPASLGKE